MSENQNPPMGWYPDPAGSTQERYWDGNSWTNNLRPTYVSQQNQPQTGYGYTSYPQVAASGGPTTADGVPLAGWWSRVGASIIDGFILGFALNILLIPFSMGMGPGFARWLEDVDTSLNTPSPLDPQYGIAGPFVAMTLVSVLLSFAYGFLMLRFKGATLGQMALGIGVVPTDNGRATGGLTWGKAALRQCTYLIIGQIPIVGLVSYLMPLWTQKRQTFHDMVAQTQMVRTR
ncbi:RDD family protein [Propionimicrobium lymphophilum]|uniref:RDD family protein n=1 Tax=Propionimicrobium lymphophilum TaxID=33012 RepID=UPI003EC8A72C